MNRVAGIARRVAGTVAVSRTAGFERHLEDKMNGLGFSRDEWLLDRTSGKPAMRMTDDKGQAALRDLASRLRPDFNAKVSGDVLVFLSVRQAGLSPLRSRHDYGAEDEDTQGNALARWR